MRGNGKAYRFITACLCLLTVAPSLFGQEEREYIRKGNRLFKKGEFAGSEGMYRKAEEQARSGNDAIFNLGDALYRQNRFSEASAEFSRAAKAGETDSLKRADGLYNLGNSLLKEQKFEESINAYISSLKLNPGNIQAKYNLAYAQDQLKKQQEQQQQQDQDKDQKQDENKDQQQDKQDQEQKEDQDQKQEPQTEQNQQQQPDISREDAKRLLDALAAKEKEAQDKVQRDKAAKAKVRVIKNW